MNRKITTLAATAAFVAASQLVATPAANATIYRTPVTADTAPQGYVDVVNSLPIEVLVVLSDWHKGHGYVPRWFVYLEPGSSSRTHVRIGKVKYEVVIDGRVFDKGVARHVLRRVDPPLR